jgi:hypothetical protein
MLGSIFFMWLLKSMCGLSKDDCASTYEHQSGFKVGVIYVVQQMKVMHNVGKVCMVQQND